METIKSVKIKQDGAFSEEYQLGINEVVISTEEPQDTSKLWINPNDTGIDTPLAEVAYTGEYSALKNKPTNVSTFTNDAGYLTDFTEKDPTVPAHVKSITAQNITDWNNKSEFDGQYSSLTGQPTQLSQFTNDGGFIDNTVSNLVNYYTKADSYQKSEVDSMIKSITTIDIKVVEQLPSSEISTHTIYLVPKGTPVAAAAAASGIERPDFEGSMSQEKLIVGPDATTFGAESDMPMAIAATNNAYDEYIYVESKWEMIGSTEVDLSGYLTKQEASTTYLSIANAGTTYLTQESAKTTYLDKNTASTTYLDKNTAGETYLDKTAAGQTYLDKNTASATYLRAEQATDEADALAKSAKNPNVLYYWV